MENFALRAALTGILWGIWPILMSKSGLGGNVSSFVFIGVMFVFVLPFAVAENSFGSMPTEINWTFAVIAGILGAIGTLIFNGMLANAPVKKLGIFIVIMIITQTIVPATFQAYNNGGLTIRQGFGFAFAIISAMLLIV